MALVAHFDLELHQMDVKTAFLNENLDEEVYMDQPEGFLIKGKEHMIVPDAIHHRKEESETITLKQKSEESLKDYISRFNKEALQVDDYSDKMILSAMISGLKEGRFLFSIGKNPPTTLGELINHAQKYINAEEFFSSRNSNQISEHSSKEKRRKDKMPQQTNKRRSDNNASRDRRPSRRPESKFSSYTSLNTSLEQIFLDIRDQRLLHWLSCMKMEAGQQDKHKYCRFHHDHGHNISDCVDLKEEIEIVIRKGHLHQYVKEEKQAGKDDQPGRAANKAMEIQTIYGGPSRGGDSNRASKAYSRSIDLEHDVYSADRLRKEL
ncbi:uncharacterized protein LOC131224249 [Magnolia sinica]|uniref:uncharacterized protein LOC131224249 n=1 Tax=Magnolia sinica TaxID=86752 RepID=UPI00265A7300|nr:uncharacterized protein LOC131224249 [Magnolia sinica]